jgi:hypothetical protein
MAKDLSNTTESFRILLFNQRIHKKPLHPNHLEAL